MVFRPGLFSFVVLLARPIHFCSANILKGTLKVLSNITMYCISDIRDLELPKTCETEFPDPDDLLNFKLVISPDEVRQAHSNICRKLRSCPNQHL